MRGRGRVALGCLALTSGLALASCSGGSKNPSTLESKPPDVQAQSAATPSKTEAPKAPGTPAATSSNDVEYAPERAAGAVKGVPAPTNTAPIVAVANYFTDLPGLDLTNLQPRQKERLLQRVNSELCTCGCRNDTLARCYVNDPRCPVVKGMVQRVYDEVRNGK